MADEVVDQVARDMASAAFFAWGNLLGTIVDTMGQANVPESLIHDFLDRLCEANESVLRDPYRGGYHSIVRVVRESATNTQ